MIQPDNLDRHEEELIAPARREFDALRARHRDDPPPPSSGPPTRTRSRRA